jgi:gas vesicle protein
MEEKSSGSGATYFIVGAILGAAAGILFAPMRGSETRENLGDLGRRSRDRAQELIKEVRKSLPGRVKVGAAVGAAKGALEGATQEAVNATHEGIREFSES